MLFSKQWVRLGRVLSLGGWGAESSLRGALASAPHGALILDRRKLVPGPTLSADPSPTRGMGTDVSAETGVQVGGVNGFFPTPTASFAACGQDSCARTHTAGWTR